MSGLDSEGDQATHLDADGSKSTARALLTAIDVANAVSPVLAHAPAQRILLALYLASGHARQGNVVPTGLTPQSGWRWVSYLETLGLLKQKNGNLRLSEEGKRLISDTLRRIVAAQAKPD